MITMDMILTSIITVVSSAISSCITWVLARRKNEAEAESVEVGNESVAIQNLITAWEKQQLIIDKSIDTLQAENKKLKEKIEKLEDTVLKLSTSICTDLTCQLRKIDYNSLLNKED